VGPHGDPGVAWISKLFVAPRARHVGLGRALLEAAHDAARGRGCTAVGLRTRAVFTPAVRLYESLGYLCTGETTSPERVYFRTL
jgi:GNAT superfamily N-acetyltransferase